MTSLEYLIPLIVVSVVFSGFMIRLFRNNWKKPFASLTERVKTLENKQVNSETVQEEFKKLSFAKIQKLHDDIVSLRTELTSELKEMEKEYHEAIDDREDRIAERIGEQSRRIEKLDDHLREVSRELIQVARFWNDPQHYRIQK